MREYVAGFMFNQKPVTSVALVLKLRPAWQANRHNGIGGKIEPGESPLEAMIREFREETGVHHEEWEHTVTLFKENDFRVYFFRAFSDQVFEAQSLDEPIKVLPVEDLPRVPTIGNVQWLVPLQLDPFLKHPITIEEK